MANGTLAPLYPMGPHQQSAWLVQGGDAKTLAPLLWQTWTGSEPTKTLPNPASNRAISNSAGFANELMALTTLAQSLEQTANKVTAAHATFLSNQEAALDQIQQISSLLQAISDQN